MTRGEAISQAQVRLQEAGIPTLESRAEALSLLRFVTGLSREELFLRPNTLLTPEEWEQFDAVVIRRSCREPLAYITGYREFYGQTFSVTTDVLIPRPETEGVVEEMLALRNTVTPTAILDLCTGSGAIAIAVAVHWADIPIVATDISEAALAVAQTNAERNGVGHRIAFFAGDLFAPIPSAMRFDIIAANPPYIAPEEILQLEPEVRDYEPRIALGIHPDPLYFYRRIATESITYLHTNGHVIVEVGQGQAETVTQLFTTAGFTNVHTIPDLAGIPRVVVATFSPPPKGAGGEKRKMLFRSLQLG